MNRPRTKDRHLPPCVYFKHGRYWYVKRGKWTDLGTDLALALAEYGRLIQITAGSMPMRIDDVMPHLCAKVAPTTRAQYETAAKILKRKLAQFNPDQVLPRHVAAIKQSMAGTPNMANRVLSVLRMVFAELVERQIADSNPCIGIARHAEARRGRYITDDEYRRIEEHATPRLRVLMALCYLTGQRVGDVMAIRHADITDAGIAFTQQKTGSRLLVRMTPDLESAVKDAKALGGNVRAMTLLYGRGGKPLDYRTVHRQWADACDAAQVPDARLHDLRAKALTDAKRQGHDPQALGGHASMAMTMRYIRLRETPQVEGPSFGRPKDSAGNC